MLRIGTVFGLLTLLVPFSAAPAHAGDLGGGTVYEWSFHEYLSDGAGGFTGPVLVESGTQTDGPLSEAVALGTGGGPHAELFSSDAAADVWGFARAPFSPNEAGDPIGARAELRVTRTFRKDDQAATLRFTIPDSEIGAGHFFGPDNEGLIGRVIHEVEAGDFFVFSEAGALTGTSGAWDFEDSGVLPYAVVQGGLDQSGVTVAFTEPYVRDIDLSSVSEGEEFSVAYQLIAEAIDTVQMKSGVQAFGRDALDEADGVTFETSGLTPIPAPEPARALLLCAGGAVLVGWGRRRA
jgi:hypothetical protein